MYVTQRSKNIAIEKRGGKPLSIVQYERLEPLIMLLHSLSKTKKIKSPFLNQISSNFAHT